MSMIRTLAIAALLAVLFVATAASAEITSHGSRIRVEPGYRSPWVISP